MKPAKSQIHPTDSLESLISTWEKAYALTLTTNKAKMDRLRELESWDDSNGHSVERNAKIQALKRLIP